MTQKRGVRTRHPKTTDGSLSRATVEQTGEFDDIAHDLSDHSLSEWCPHCGSRLRAQWSGVDCIGCNYTFCF